jgi:cytochrome c556
VSDLSRTLKEPDEAQLLPRCHHTMVKLPLPFKQLGMSIHKDMDALAEAIAQNETPQQSLQRLSSMTARCTACHDMYRFGAGQ